MKKISIIIPIYNMEKHLSKCIDSILKQTFSNFELILVNDGSTDSSASICDSYQEKDDRVIAIHKENGGVSSTRNKGLEVAQGEYIGFIDPDDYIDENMYQILYNNIEKYNADISICGNCDVRENGEIISTTVEGSVDVIDPATCIKGILNEELYLGTCWNKLYKKSLFLEERFDTSLAIAEDLDILMKVIPRAETIVYDSTPLYYWIYHDNSTIHKSFIDSQAKWDKEVNLCESLIDKFKDDPNGLMQYAIKRYVRINFFCISRIILENNDREILAKYRSNIMKYYKEFMSFDFVNKSFKLKVFLIKINPRLIKFFNFLSIKLRNKRIM